MPLLPLSGAFALHKIKAKLALLYLKKQSQFGSFGAPVGTDVPLDPETSVRFCPAATMKTKD
jgi:hypothetical protein